MKLYDGLDFGEYDEFDDSDICDVYIMFINFLESKGALDNYIKNFNNVDNGWMVDNWSGYHSDDIDYSIMDFVCNLYKNRNKLFIINYSFSWSKTPEGGRYWLQLEREWIDYVNNKLNMNGDVRF
jgi:hypothetical protein